MGWRSPKNTDTSWGKRGPYLSIIATVLLMFSLALLTTKFEHYFPNLQISYRNMDGIIGVALLGPFIGYLLFIPFGLIARLMIKYGWAGFLSTFILTLIPTLCVSYWRFSDLIYIDESQAYKLFLFWLALSVYSFTAWLLFWITEITYSRKRD
jgi:hypothetical protein